MTDRTDRELLAEAADALQACSVAAQRVKPSLTVPYPDAPAWSPWTRWAEAPARRAHDLRARIRRHLDATAVPCTGCDHHITPDLSHMYETKRPQDGGTQ